MMTKHDLIEFLMGFEDDIQIISYNDISGVYDIQPVYYIASQEQVDELKYNKIEVIQKGDGFVVI